MTGQGGKERAQSVFGVHGGLHGIVYVGMRVHLRQWLKFRGQHGKRLLFAIGGGLADAVIATLDSE